MHQNSAEQQPKRKKSILKKILIGFGIFIVAIIILSQLFPIDYYKDGMDYYNKQNYKKAYEYLNKVKPEDKNYNDAIAKVQTLKPIIDSIETSEKLAKEQGKAEKQQQNEQQNAAEDAQKEREKALKENPYLDYPKAQQDFIAAIKQFEQEYEKADNELRKSAVRTKRGEAFKTALNNSRSFSNWVGIVKTMETTSNGKANFGIEIKGTGITMMNMNNEFSDIMDNTLIEQSNPLYQKIAELKKGDRVLVSGEFLKSDKSDFVYEMSMTEAGSMENPDFIVKFKDVQK